MIGGVVDVAALADHEASGPAVRRAGRPDGVFVVVAGGPSRQDSLGVGEHRAVLDEGEWAARVDQSEDVPDLPGSAVAETVGSPDRGVATSWAVTAGRTVIDDRSFASITANVATSPTMTTAAASGSKRQQAAAFRGYVRERAHRRRPPLGTSEVGRIHGDRKSVV